MIKVYRMPNGHKYRFEETDAPAGAVLVTKRPAEKAAVKKPNKAKKSANKAKKAAVK